MSNSYSYAERPRRRSASLLDPSPWASEHGIPVTCGATVGPVPVAAPKCGYCISTLQIGIFGKNQPLARKLFFGGGQGLARRYRRWKTLARRSTYCRPSHGRFTPCPVYDQ